MRTKRSGSVGGGLAYGAYGALVAMGEAIARDGDFKSLGANAEGAKRIRGFLKQG